MRCCNWALSPLGLFAAPQIRLPHAVQNLRDLQQAAPPAATCSARYIVSSSHLASPPADAALAPARSARLVPWELRESKLCGAWCCHHREDPLCGRNPLDPGRALASWTPHALCLRPVTPLLSLPWNGRSGNAGNCDNFLEPAPLTSPAQ
ncbi:hypothetical protein B0J12DRAFT_700581 [Macrophomina phaseolina]|uniref:Uncharacterized protein n=1 Tax=Macrophomina phaseolina TaxID=35725 RepID=A0ABQ8GAH7_9PEZI|nr:hypothetical protein B0J12DRAFT_700581 [Macrophomina phaseolina]